MFTICGRVSFGGQRGINMKYTICLIWPKGYSYGPKDINIPYSVRCVCVSGGVDTWLAVASSRTICLLSLLSFSRSRLSCALSGYPPNLFTPSSSHLSSIFTHDIIKSSSVHHRISILFSQIRHLLLPFPSSIFSPSSSVPPQSLLPRLLPLYDSGIEHRVDSSF